MGAVLVFLLIRRSRGKTALLLRPLVAGILSMNGIALVILLGSRLARNDVAFGAGDLRPSVLSLAADTAILGLKFGWLFAFLTFLRRFALPLGRRPFRRLAAVVGLPVALLVAGGWAEFLLTSRRDVFDKLQYVTDYLVFLAMIGAGLYLRSRTAVLVRREAARAIITLAGFALSVFLALGLWWIIGGSVWRAAPGWAAAFNPFLLLVFNGGLAFWVFRYSRILSAPEMLRYAPRPVSESLSFRLGISRREGEIIGLVGQGLSNQEIADRLFISLFTVKKHLNTIFLKAGVANRVQLVRLFADEARQRDAEPDTEPAASPKS